MFTNDILSKKLARNISAGEMRQAGGGQGMCGPCPTACSCIDIYQADYCSDFTCGQPNPDLQVGP